MVQSSLAMPANLPEPEIVFRAIDSYLGIAYGGAQPPIAVRSLLSTLQTWAGKFYNCPVWVKDDNLNPKKLQLRLGNRGYPHMKLVLEQAPDESTYFFRADTHDRHCCPPDGAPEHGAFVELMNQNQQIAQQIEQAWAEGEISTFKSWLKRDLARRQGNG